MRHPFNVLSLAALPALVSLLCIPSGDRDYLCYLGFLVFLRYLWVNPDELFLHTVRRAATSAFLLEFLLLPPCLFLFYFLDPRINPMPKALAVSYAASVIFFCLYHTWLELREGKGLE